MNRDQHNTALARKFKNFEVSSGMASFEAFEAREYQKSKTLIWFELAVISLAILLTILGMANARIVNLSTKATDSSSENHASAEAKNRGIHEQEAGARQETETSKILSTDRKAKELEDRSPKVPLSLFEKQDKSEEARPLQEPLNISYDASYLPAKELKGIPYQIIGLQDLPKSGKSPLKVEKPNIKPFPGLLRTSLEFGLGMQMGNYLVQAEPNADLYVHKNYQEFMSKSIHRVPLPSFRLGILRKASPLFSYSLGIAFTQWGLNTEYNYEVGTVPVYNLEGEITGYLEDSLTNPISLSSKHRYQIISAPFSIRYNHELRNFHSYIRLGLSINYLLSAEGMFINEFSVTEFTPIDRLKQNRTTLSTELALGLRRAIAERTSLALEFSYSQFMAPIAHTDYYAFSSRAVGFNFIITQDLKFKR